MEIYKYNIFDLYKKIACALIIFDVTNNKSFTEAKKRFEDNKTVL